MRGAITRASNEPAAYFVHGGGNEPWPQGCYPTTGNKPMRRPTSSSCWLRSSSAGPGVKRSSTQARTWRPRTSSSRSLVPPGPGEYRGLCLSAGKTSQCGARRRCPCVSQWLQFGLQFSPPRGPPAPAPFVITGSLSDVLKNQAEVSSSATSSRTRRSISSRMARTSSTGSPVGSGRSQSRYRLPGM